MENTNGNYWYNNFVPTICSFDGITIRMYYDDHLPAHFHVAFSGEFAKVGIDPITILAGTMPRNIRSKVFEWTAIHQAELRANWELAKGHQPLFQIEPLD